MKLLNIVLIICITFIFTACGNTKYVYVQPVYPKISAPRKVPLIEGTFIRKRCLWLKDHNTNLCGNDYKVIAGTIGDLRINDATFRENIANYNDFVAKEKQRKIEIK